MADVAPPAFKKRAPKSSTIRKRPATPPPDNSSSDSDYTSDEAGTRVKRRKKNTAPVTTSTLSSTHDLDLSKSTKYAADRSTTIAANEDATKASNWYLEASKATPPSATKHSSTNPAQGAYTGTSNYSTYLPRNPESASVSKSIGPVKAPTNVRTITVTDFAPDVCKDYKQTGFCGFGDGCKFLHAREDYKQGWQLDKEWDKKTITKAKKDQHAQPADVDGEGKAEEDIPFACIICKQPYKHPVVTKCGHYFCEKCAMQRYMKEKKRTCANCGRDTGGSFGVAKKLVGLLEEKRRRMVEKGEEDGESAAS